MLCRRSKHYVGLAHHCDWVPTLVGAAGGTLNDTTTPAVDGMNLWPALLDTNAASAGPRTHVLLNVDVTNQGVINDPGGWSGYAGVVVKSSALGHLKLVLGNPGTPNAWCWPNQNGTGVDDTGAPACVTYPGKAFPGHDLTQRAATTWQACCAHCTTTAHCNAWTWHPDQKASNCWLKANVSMSAAAACSSGCVSGTSGSTPLPPAPPAAPSNPMPDPQTLTCSFNGKVPANRTGAILFDLARDPTETTNLAGTSAQADESVRALRALLDVYIASAVPPLNELPAQRKADPRAKAAAEQAKCWVPWDNRTGATVV